jgi:hypothetical protein
VPQQQHSTLKAVLRATLFSLGCYLLAMASQMQVDLV